MQAHLKRLQVNTEGLNYIHQKLLDIYNSGIQSRPEIYTAFWADEKIYGMGDSRDQIFTLTILARVISSIYKPHYGNNVTAIGAFGHSRSSACQERLLHKNRFAPASHCYPYKGCGIVLYMQNVLRVAQIKFFILLETVYHIAVNRFAITCR
jgi:hypothetical protein